MRLLAALLLLVALPLAATAQPGARPAGPQPPHPDSLVLQAYRALIRDDVVRSRFVVTTEGESYSGRLTTYAPPPDGVFHYRFDFDKASLGMVAVDGRALQHGFALTRCIYVDSTGNSLADTPAAIFAMHPSVSLGLYQFHKAAESKTYVGPDTAGRRAGQRTRLVSALRDDETQVTLSPATTTRRPSSPTSRSTWQLPSSTSTSRFS